MSGSTRDAWDGARADSGRGPQRTRRRTLAAAILLAVTLAGGWAAGKVQVAGEARTSGVASRDGIHFGARLDRGSVLQRGDGLVRMELRLEADARPDRGGVRVPTDLIVVLDRSGSMQGQPLLDAIASVRDLVRRLGPEDRFALVTYASDVDLAISLEPATSENRARWSGTLSRIVAGGGTNMAIGIDVAADVVARHREASHMPRVILLSDGHANQGDHSRSGLAARAGRAVSGEYVLSAVGVGLDFDEQLMTSLADAGTGNFYYVREGSDLGEVFAGEFAAASETVATGLAVEIDLAPGVDLVDAAGYPVEREGRRVRFRPGSLFAGQDRRVWLGLRAPTQELGIFSLGDFRLRYRDAARVAITGSARSGGGEAASADRVLTLPGPLAIACVAGEDRFIASLDRDLVLEDIAKDGLSSLKQDVARAVAAGNRKEAEERIAAYKRRNATVYRSLGVAPAKTESFVGASALEDEVADAFAPRPAAAAAAAKKSIAKTLSLEGQDGRRQGAKNQGAKNQGAKNQGAKK